MLVHAAGRIIAVWYYATQSGGRSRRVNLRTARRVMARYRALHRAERARWHRLRKTEAVDNY